MVITVEHRRHHALFPACINGHQAAVDLHVFGNGCLQATVGEPAGKQVSLPHGNGQGIVILAPGRSFCFIRAGGTAVGLVTERVSRRPTTGTACPAARGNIEEGISRKLVTGQNKPAFIAAQILTFTYGHRTGTRVGVGPEHFDGAVPPLIGHRKTDLDGSSQLLQGLA